MTEPLPKKKHKKKHKHPKNASCPVRSLMEENKKEGGMTSFARC